MLYQKGQKSKSRCIWKKHSMMCKTRSKRSKIKTFLSKLKIDKDRVSVVISTNKSKTKIRTTSPLQKEFSKKKREKKKKQPKNEKPIYDINFFATTISAYNHIHQWSILHRSFANANKLRNRDEYTLVTVDSVFLLVLDQ